MLANGQLFLFFDGILVKFHAQCDIGPLTAVGSTEACTPIQVMAQFHTREIGVAAITCAIEVVEDVFGAILQRHLGATLSI